ncbi:MAG: RnfABCDGE type electron transport complex subunit G [Thermodesulfobacteriota bacterium]|jgi:electron transport complex protein RnfG|nr:RnfABCDGE type electron transport complex subunit G [Thermodesulfobacteriota bacterium]
MKDMARLVIVLTLITVCAGLVLSLVENFTREPIAEQRRLETLRALSAVLPEFDNSPDQDRVVISAGMDKKGKPVERTFYLGRSDGKINGIAFEVVAPDGYSGEIVVMAGVRPDGTLVAVEILRHSETPGLGDKIEEDWFKRQFKGKRLDSADWRVKKDGGDFDEITGATISPRAVVGALRRGLEFFHENRGAIIEGGGDGS